jgi:hypothetical protein
MKKIFAISAILLVALLLVVSFSLAFADTETQPSSQVTPVPGGPGWMWNNEDGAYSHGPGMMWGDEDGEYSHGPGMMSDSDGQFFGRHGGMWGNDGDYQDNPMHDVMVAPLAEVAGLTVDDFNARLTEGDTMIQILESAGLSAEEITEAYNNAHDAARQAAVDEGWMTQEQADWMDERMQGKWDAENGAHHGACGGNYSGSNL